ncbi:MAG: HAD-IA family hydrolase [Lautropia sp.]|nr:HAD-IA family hydrolase [Lautropia sp.]
MLLPQRPLAVFFDLDGTLADTADDLAAPVNAMRRERGQAPMPVEELRPFASAGARGLIGKGLGVGKEDPAYEALRLEFLERYEQDIVVHTRLFDGMDELLRRLEAEGVRWGVISNKIERYVRIIVQRLGLAERLVVAYGGDSAARPKPHPDLMLLALETTGFEGGRCVYVGDDLRDVVAGRAAGMKTVAAAYGYCGDADSPEKWGADALIRHPTELAPLLGL